MNEEKFVSGDITIWQVDTGIMFSDRKNNDIRKFDCYLDCLSWLYANGKKYLADAYKKHMTPTPQKGEEQSEDYTDLVGRWALPKSISKSTRFFSDYKKIVWHEKPWVKLSGEGEALYKEESLFILSSDMAEKVDSLYKELGPNFKPDKRKKQWE